MASDMQAEDMQTDNIQAEAAMVDEGDVAMTLGQRLFEISKVDPVVKNWVDTVAKENKRRTGCSTGGALSTSGGTSKKVYPASGCQASDALSIAGETFLSQVDVSEVYSPPRVTSMAKKMGMHAGSAMDLRTGFDFTRKEDRDRARKRSKKRSHTSLWDHQNALCSPHCSSYRNGQ